MDCSAIVYKERAMLFRRETLDRVVAGSVSLAFRRWERPLVRGGGTQLTAVGELSFLGIREVAAESISADEARMAGSESSEQLLAELGGRESGNIYRIELGPLRPDPRIALRSLAPTGEEMRELTAKLRRLDSRASSAVWTLAVLDIIRAHPGVRAGELCGMVAQEKEQFKLNVRKLKNLGLTESLKIGYRLSPRGQVVLDAIRRTTQQSHGF